MAGKSKGPLDQRLKDLEKEVSRVRGDIKSLSKAVQDPDLGDLPLIQYGRSQAAEEQAASPDAAPDPVRPKSPAVRKDLEPSAPGDREGPASRPSPKPERKPPAEPAPAPKDAPEPPPPPAEEEPGRETPPAGQALTESEGVLRSRVLSGGPGAETGGPVRRHQEAGSLSKDYRFASYLSAVSMSSPGPTRRERSVQRNKAIVMVVLVLVALYVVVKLLT